MFASLEHPRITGIEHKFDVFNIAGPTDTSSREGGLRPHMSTDPNRHAPTPILVDLTPAEFRTHLPNSCPSTSAQCDIRAAPNTTGHRCGRSTRTAAAGGPLRR